MKLPVVSHVSAKISRRASGRYRWMVRFYSDSIEESQFSNIAMPLAGGIKLQMGGAKMKNLWFANCNHLAGGARVNQLVFSAIYDLPGNSRFLDLRAPLRFLLSHVREIEGPLLKK